MHPATLPCDQDPDEYVRTTTVRSSVWVNADTQISAETHRTVDGGETTTLVFHCPRSGSVFELNIPLDRQVEMFRAMTAANDERARLRRPGKRR